MKGLIRYTIFILLLCSFGEALANPNIVYIGQQEPRYELRRLFLKISLSIQLDEDLPDYQVLPAKYEKITQARLLQMLENEKGIDVVFLTYTQERAQRVRMVPIPILQGSIGYRVFIIDKNDKHKFSRITLEELKKLKAGSGLHWGDTSILEQNGFNVVKGTEKSNLLNMMIGGRFDYFPRGIGEALNEVRLLNQMVGEERFIIEETKAFFYEFPIYYYVHKDNEQLAKRIEAGFKKAQKLGIIESLFQKYHEKEFQKANFADRTVFELRNTNFPDGFKSNIDTSEWMPEKK